MKLIQQAAIALAIFISPHAHAAPAPEPGLVDAPEGSVAIPLYGKVNPGKPSDEARLSFGNETLLLGVTYPTLTPVLPAPGKANGAAVIVAPGGGFLMLALQNEGWRVARALADQGVTAFVLKYRLRQPEGDPMLWLQSEGQKLATTRPGGQSIPARGYAPAAEDGLAALRLVRTRAAEWQIDPKRVGMIGFSAGAMTTLETVRLSANGEGHNGPPDFIGWAQFRCRTMRRRCSPQSRWTISSSAMAIFPSFPIGSWPKSRSNCMPTRAAAMVLVWASLDRRPPGSCPISSPGWK